MTPDVSVIVPAFNEAHRIAQSSNTIAEALQASKFSWELLVVLDGGAPGSIEALGPIAARWPQLRVLDNGLNRGKGFSVRRGVADARGARVAFLDADLALPVSALLAMLDRLDAGPDVVIASRAVAGARAVGTQPRLRGVMGRVFNLAVQSVILPGIRDTQCGLKVFRGDLARQVFAAMTVDRFGFDVEALYLSRRLGAVIEEFPVTVTYDGASSIQRGPDALVMLADLVRIRVRHMRRR